MVTGERRVLPGGDGRRGIDLVRLQVGAEPGPKSGPGETARERGWHAQTGQAHSHVGRAAAGVGEQAEGSVVVSGDWFGGHINERLTDDKHSLRSPPLVARSPFTAEARACRG
jgi:hypothetical protein